MLLLKKVRVIFLKFLNVTASHVAIDTGTLLIRV